MHGHLTSSPSLGEEEKGVDGVLVIYRPSWLSEDARDLYMRAAVKVVKLERQPVSLRQRLDEMLDYLTHLAVCRDPVGRQLRPG